MTTNHKLIERMKKAAEIQAKKKAEQQEKFKALIEKLKTPTE